MRLSRRQTRRLRDERRLALVAVVLLAMCAPQGALAALDKPAAGQELSPRLDALASPELRNASPREQARQLGLPVRGPGSLTRQGDSVVVELRVAGDARDGSQAARLAGAEILDVSPRYDTISALVAPESLRDLAQVSGVESVTEVLAPITSQAGRSDPETAAAECGSVNSEGDTQLKAVQARSQLGVDGSGIEVGALSDSYNKDATADTTAAQDISTGDLPGPGNPCGWPSPVDVLDDSQTGNDEGRAMLQLVHDLAPGAALSFATAFGGQFAMAGNIGDLRDAGADVIVDDVSYFEEPFFQDGPISVAVDDVSASGVVYYSSAANSNIQDSLGRDIASWEAPSFRDANSCPAGVPAYATSCMDFDPGAGVDTAFNLTVPDTRTLRIDLQWAQPWLGVSSDIDMYLLTSPGAVELASSEDFNDTTQKPFEFLSWENTTGSAKSVVLVINNYNDVGAPRLKWIAMGGRALSSSEYPVSSGGDVVGPTIFGHNGTAEAMSTAAVPFNNSATIESFSSRGPVTHYFGPVAGTSPAPPLPSPSVLPKPDVSATDGVLNTFFPSGTHRFFGTSAAAPHAAAVAALQLDQDPEASVAEVKAAQKTTVDPVDAFPPEAQGAGLVDAFDAVVAMGATPLSPSPSPAPPSPSPAPQPAGDTNPPDTQITAGPKRKTSKRRASFSFASSEPGSSFECKLDGEGFVPCDSPQAVKVSRGRHTFEVRARDAAGNTDPTPAEARWRVKQKK
ncbi:MAG TPA: S8 family serine peptidase [Solirubrobacterales bacterium]|nr:S8 family serine peptidase [Solirubrobacterales bacterium]